ncbi:hypothetical protein [Azohydromonas sediminis]|uniref:hypothetical protein n=1 Tax=Azohydromonas sediminis TaxID=2259674 RepID=UPI000E654D71|nr:hypothetical protein [Azohydromonas sediminis]
MTSIRSLSSLVPWRWFARARHGRRRRGAASTRVQDGTADVLPALAGDDDLPRGCAWYPSSFELVHGTDVREDDAAALACG